jgi:hypothetical protein
MEFAATSKINLFGARTVRPVEKIYIGVKFIHLNLPWPFARNRPGLIPEGNILLSVRPFSSTKPRQECRGFFVRRFCWCVVRKCAPTAQEAQ